MRASLALPNVNYAVSGFPENVTQHSSAWLSRTDTSSTQSERLTPARRDGLRCAATAESRGQKIIQLRSYWAFTAAASLKYAGLLLWLGDLADEQRQAIWEKLSGQPSVTFVQQQGALVSCLLDLANEARDLQEVVL